MEISGDIPQDKMEDTLSVIGINSGIGINLTLFILLPPI